jgi:hypothetical protein
MTTLRQLVRTARAGAPVFLVLVASTASADITGGALKVTAVNLEGDSATIEFAMPAGESPWVWLSDQPTELRSPTTGALIAVLNPEGRESRVEYVNDPLVSMVVSVQAGSQPTTFTISSALLSFPLLTFAEGRASAGFSVTDVDGDGALLTGIGDPSGSQGAYLAQYNGFAGTLSGTTFAEVIQTISADPFATTTAAEDVPVLGFTPILDPVGDISAVISFQLSANDIASGTSVWVVQQQQVAVEAATWSHVKALY